MDTSQDPPNVLDYRTPEGARGGLGDPVSPGGLTSRMRMELREESERLNSARKQSLWGIWLRIFGPVFIIIGFITIGGATRSDDSPAIVGSAVLMCGVVCFISGLFLRGQAELIRWAGRQ